MNSDTIEKDEQKQIDESVDMSDPSIDNSADDTAVSDWQRRHDEIESAREEIRTRVRNTRRGNGVLRPAKPKPTINDAGEKRVGIYARVSTKSTEQTSSIENQTLYYRKRVADEPQWTLQEIFSDEGKSGTSTKHRKAFNRMVQAAENKEIDLILCASVSRFARNMSDCMTYIRQLKSANPSHPVGVYFETENIYTLDPDSSKQLGVHAMLADWESANKSARMILSYDQRICTGQYPVCDLLGFRHTKDGDLIIQPEEAKTVRFIFLAYLLGYDCKEIAELLTEKERPTLKGRTEWNSSMVRNIMGNERRWGDLEARKTIVIDYVEHKSKRNEDERVSAYQEGHHTGIVSPEIARAVKMMSASSRGMQGGVSDIIVIQQGALKGFVSINPGWGGIDHSTFLQICTENYTDEELTELEHEIHIWSGDESSKILSMQFTGYEVPRGVYFMNRMSPSLTISKKGIKLSKACHDKLDGCQYIEVLYHPILQTLIIRPSTAEAPNSILWEKSDGSPITDISAKAFSKSIFDNMRWKPDYRFKFRGITKERGGIKFLVFALDEPQIIPSAKDRIVMPEDDDMVQTIKYISYRIDDEAQTEDETVACHRYPAEWEGIVGLNYSVQKRREKLIKSITEADIRQNGTFTINPMIGDIPSRQEIQTELSNLLMSM